MSCLAAALFFLLATHYARAESAACWDINTAVLDAYSKLEEAQNTPDMCGKQMDVIIAAYVGVHAALETAQAKGCEKKTTVDERRGHDAELVEKLRKVCAVDK